MVKCHTRFRTFRGNAIISRAEYPHHRLIPWLKCVAVLGILIPTAPIAYALNVGGPITTTTTWHLSDSPVIVTSDVTVNGVELSIEPGVVVKFNIGLNIVFNNGTLIAPGTLANPIYFTSINDDSVGGVASGSTGNPAPGDWQFVQLNSSSATLANVHFRYGGLANNFPEFWLVGATATFTGGEASFSAFDGILAQSNSVLNVSSVTFLNDQNWGIDSQQSSLPVMSNNTFDGDAQGFRINTPQNVQASGNTLENLGPLAAQIDPGVMLQGFDGAMVIQPSTGPAMNIDLLGATVNNSITWLSPGLPFLNRSGVTFASGAQLTLPAGTILKMAGTNLTLSGGLNATGTVGKQIFITSLNDNSVGGIAPGSTGSPAQGDWQFVQVNTSNATLANVHFRYGGLANNFPEFWLVGATATFTGGEASFSAFDGILAQSNSVLNVSSLTFLNDQNWGIDSQQSSLPIMSSDTFNGDTQGFRINTPQNVQASGITLENLGPLAAQIDPGVMLQGFDGATVIQPSTAPVMNIDLLGATVNNSIAWLSPGLPFLNRSGVTFASSAQLTLPAGTILKMAGTNLTLSGGLTTIGTVAKQIFITSLNDNSVGGSAPGSTGNPAPGDWQFVQVNNSSATLANVHFRYGGLANNFPEFWLVGATATFTGGEASFSSFDGILAQNNSVLNVSSVTFLNDQNWGIDSQQSSLPVMSNDTFNGDAQGFRISTPQNVQASGNTLENLGPLAAQIDPGIMLQGFDGATVIQPSTAPVMNIDLLGATVNNSITWLSPGLPFLNRSGVTFAPGAQLTLPAGTVLKMAGTNLTLSGGLTAIGTVGKQIFITSLNDNSVGGSAPGSTGSPAPGDWQFVQVNTSSAALANVHFRYGGLANNFPEFWLVGATATFMGGEASFSSFDGILAQSNSVVSVSSITISSNAIGVAASVAQVDIHQCSIFGNSQFGVENLASSPIVQAQFNYWGSTTGPTNASNPGGTGDIVSNFVNFIPFLSSPVQVLPPQALSVTLNDPNPTQSKTVHFQVLFSNLMNTSVAPLATFGLISPFQTFTAFRGTFVSSTVWQSSATIPNNATDGSYFLRISSAMDLSGNHLVISTFSFYTVDNTPPFVAITSPTAGTTISRPFKATAVAVDTTGVTNVVFAVDGLIQSTVTLSPQPLVLAPVAFFWDTRNFPDGSHLLTATATDLAGNIARSSVTVTLNYQLPAPPVITIPANDFATNVGTITVSGTAEFLTEVDVLVNNLDVTTTAVNVLGQWSTSIILPQQHDIVLEAISFESRGFSVLSSSVTGIFTTAKPSPPESPIATPIPGGQVSLSWSAPSQGEVPKFYRIYRSTNSADLPSGGTPLVSDLLADNVTQTQFTDSPAVDDLYFYAMTSVDAAGNESVLSDEVFALSDLVPPTAAVSVATVTTPAGPGSYPLNIYLSEVLSQPPVLTFTPQGQSPTPLNLNPLTATLWQSTLTITNLMSSGTATFGFQGIDFASNLGTTLTAGATLPIQTVGPIGTITLSKISPLSVGSLTFTLTLNEPSVSTPTLSITPQVGSPIVIPLASTGAFDSTAWFGGVIITSTTGDGTAVISFSATDSLGNLSTMLSGGATSFVIDTIAPGPPLSPRANPGPGGIVVLSWSAPFGELPSSYNVYRDGVRIATGIPPASDGSGTFTDHPTAGTHMYRLSSVDLAGNESTLTDPTAVSRDMPPSPPLNVVSTITFSGQIQITWVQGSTDTASFNLYRATSPIASLAGISFFKNVVTPFLDSPSLDAIYYYAVTALDSVGNESAPSTATAILWERGAPVITITGIANGGFYNTNVFPAFTVSDITLATSSIQSLLDGNPFVSGSTVSAEGIHTLTVSAANQVGHVSTSTTTFTIDKTPPVITFSGAQNGQLLHSTAAIIVTIADLNPGTSSYFLFNALTNTTVTYQSGGLIAENGSYTLIANAVDLAGNSSTATVSFQLEIGPLAPVNLAITAQNNGASLTWSKPEPDVVAYRVYRDGVRISASLYPGTSFFDPTFTPGAAHIYQVSAVDGQGVEGQKTQATVHAITLTLSAITLTRGYFDSIQATLANADTATFVAGPATIQVADANGVASSATASAIPVSPGQTGTLQGVIATPINLAPTVSVLVTVPIPTNPGALVSFQNSLTVQVQDPQSPQVEVLPGALVPGTLASVQVRFYNRGSASMDVVTGQVLNSTFAPVNNIQVQLLTNQDTLLSNAGIQQIADGANSVLTPAGQQLFFVTIPPGSSFMFDPIRVLIPNTIVSSLNVQALVSTPTYNLAGIALAGTRQFASISAQAVISSVPYTATVFPDKSFYDQGSSVTLIGKSFDLNGFALPNATVTVHVISNGFDRQVSTVTDASGNYIAEFFPLPNEAGVYNVFAAAPQVITSAPHSSFTIVGFDFSNSNFNVTLAQNSTVKFAVNVQNTGATPIAGLSASTASLSGSGVNFSLDPATLPANLAAGQSATLGLKVSALPLATTSTLSLSVTESHGFSRTLPITANIVPAQVFPTVSPSQFLIGVLSGQSITQSITLTNQGFQTWQGVNLSSPTLPWVQIQGQSFIGDIPPGGNANFSLNIAPPLSVPTTSYAQNPLLTVFSSNAPPVPINAGITVTSSQQGNLVFNIINADQPRDINGNGIPVAGATVTLTSNDIPGISFTFPADANGVARFANVPGGNYRWTVEAVGFQANSGSTVVQSGISQTVQVLMVTATVSYSWTVTPTSIIDQFNIALGITFKTSVFAPTLVVNPVEIVINQSAGQTAFTQMTITNIGLVSALDVNLSQNFSPELQVELPFTNIPEIKAQQSVTVPIKITQIRSSCPNGVVSGNYKFQCAFDKSLQTGQMPGTTVRSGSTCNGSTASASYSAAPQGGMIPGGLPYIGGRGDIPAGSGPVTQGGCVQLVPCKLLTRTNIVLQSDPEGVPILCNLVCTYDCCGIPESYLDQSAEACFTSCPKKVCAQ